MADIVGANGVVDAKAWEKAVDAEPKTKAGSHRATQKGYAGGQTIEEGEAVPAGIAVSDVWMEKVKGADKGLAERFDEVQQPHKDDPDLTQLDLAALRLRAQEAGVTSVKGLSKDDLISLINAERDRTRTQ